MASPMQQLDLIDVTPQDWSVHKCQKVHERSLTIQNPSPIDIAFKISDSMPDFITIEPDHGYIKAGDSMTVTMSILPFEESNESMLEEITVLFCPAPDRKAVQVFTSEFPWPEVCRSTQLAIHFTDEGTSSASSTSSDSRSISEKISITESKDESKSASERKDSKSDSET